MFRLPVLRLVLLLVCLSGCSRYAFNLNDNRLYTPPTLFSDYSLPDAALAACVEQSIADQGVSAPQQLLRLNCAYAGIESLAGLEVFDRLQQVNLAGNQLRDLAPLHAIALPLTVNLSGNPQLACGAIKELRMKGVEVIAPSRCHDAPPQPAD